jgi:hypothetical protein
MALQSRKATSEIKPYQKRRTRGERAAPAKTGGVTTNASIVNNEIQMFTMGVPSGKKDKPASLFKKQQTNAV